MTKSNFLPHRIKYSRLQVKAREQHAMTILGVVHVLLGVGDRGQFWLSTRLWWIVLLKVAYYATSSARNFAKLCQNYARIPKLCSWFSKLCSQNDVDSVHVGAQKRHQSIMFFKYVVVGNLYVFYGSLSRPSAVQNAHAEFVKRGLVTKHVRTKSILLLAKLKHAL